jgi:hypothetical protein
VSNELEEATDIMNEKSMPAGEGRMKAETVIGSGLYRGERRRENFELSVREMRLPARANLITSR